MNHLTIILKPTNRCNAACLYCSAWKPAKNNPIMSEKTLETIFGKLDEWVAHSKSKKNIKIIWHGGEPTLMPAAFFRRAVELEENLAKTHGLHIENNIQSNLLYLDQEKLDTLDRLLSFKGSKRSIGTSFDPLPGIRMLKNRSLSYEEEWEKSIALLEEKGFHFGIVYVVHKRSIAHIDTVARTFLTRFPHVGVRFNPLYKEGRAADSACESLYITPGEWGDFLVKLYRIWEANDKKPSWQPLKEVEVFHAGKSARMSCDYSGKCASTHLGIDTDGTVYSCGRGIDRKYKPYGNICETRFSEILRHSSRVEMANRSVFLRGTYCRECKWWRYCHGGCPMDAAINNSNDIFNKTNFCISRQHFLDTVYKEPAA